jgi:hypothetical protein
MLAGLLTAAIVLWSDGVTGDAGCEIGTKLEPRRLCARVIWSANPR